MVRSKVLLAVTITALASLTSTRAFATTEICGNDIDDDGNGLTDEGCYPTLSTGVCESPLSCADTGMVSWSTGSLHYDLPPDIAPTVPYGPAIGFRRFYTSMYSPGSSPTSINKTPLGPGWQHTYMTWIDRYTVSSIEHIVWHTSQGRDTYYTYATTSGSWKSYTAQNGEHVMSMRYNTSTLEYQVQLLTGEIIHYNQYGQVTEIDDTEPTPNSVMITWDSTTNGNVSTVTDASGEHRLLFTYSNGLMTELQYQFLVSGTWTTEHTTTYQYSHGVTWDPTSGWFVPESSTEWTELLAGTGFSNPSNLWLAQETSGNLSDSIGSSTAVAHGVSQWAQSATGWTRKGPRVSGNDYFLTPTSNVQTTSQMFLQYFHLNTVPSSGFRGFNCIGEDYYEEAELVSGPKMQAQSGSTLTASSDVGSDVLVVTKLDDTHSAFTVYDDSGDVLTPTFHFQGADTSSYLFGDGLEGPDATMLYAALFTGSAAELTDSQVASLISLMKNGHGLLTSVTIGGQLAQENTYAGNYLSKIADGSGNLIASFSYSSANPGQVDLVNTPRGTVGFEYSSSRAACSGDTMLYFNKGNATSCGSDSDCGTGYLCGGKTGSGSTGACFIAARCLTTTTVNYESVITNVSTLSSAGSGSACTGACSDVMQYVWSQGVGSNPSGLLNVAGYERGYGSGSGTSYTSILYNSNGLPTQIGYGDSDSDPTSGSNARNFFITYDTTFPGRVASTTTGASDIVSPCAGLGVPSECEETTYTYDGSNQLYQVTKSGATLNGSGSATKFSTVIEYSYNSRRQVTEIDTIDGVTIDDARQDHVRLQRLGNQSVHRLQSRRYEDLYGLVHVP